MCPKYCVVSVVKALDLEPKRTNRSQCHGQSTMSCVEDDHYPGANSSDTDGAPQLDLLLRIGRAGWSLRFVHY